ncbi:MAG: ATP-binding cassette domain-containing protein, partial [Eggerthellaceae bacterium]|nr:ATP-binding cassette domain-containing protein [Eggerthellaceae bacterium]
QLLNLASIMAMQPEVLVLDEPTSQLDPIAAADFLNTVRKINLELGTTVIITEHRLEDIYHAADQVIVMDQGRVAASGDPRCVGASLHASESPLFAALPTPVRVFYEAKAQGSCPLTVREGRSWLTAEFEDEPPAFTEPDDTMAACANSAPRSGSDLCGEPVLEMKGVWFRYEKDGDDVLRGVNLKVPQGTVFALVGGNGTGKSTMLKAACGMNKPYRGNVKVLSKPLKSYRPGELFDNCLSMLPQDPASLFAKSTVREELAEMCAGAETGIRETARLCEIEHLMDSHPYDLSGGEQQRVALAKVLLTNPRLLLLDEPTKGLDSFFKVKFAQVLARLKKRGVTIVMVSHDVEFCAEHADSVSMFFDGQILTTDTPRRFFGQNSFYTTAANRMSRCVFRNAVTARDVIDLYLRNKNAGAAKHEKPSIDRSENPA